MIRFVAGDQPNNSITEAAVDAFRIDDITCTLATWTPFGSGCPGSNGTPTASILSLPALGTSWALLVQNLGGGAAFMVVGVSTQNVPLGPYGFGSNCSLLVTTEGVRFLVQAGGVAAWNMPIPNNPVFAGLHLYSQVIELGTISAVSAGGDALIQQ